MSAHFLDDERIADLLVLEVTEGLDPAQRQELEALLAGTSGMPDALAGAAAAVTLAARLPSEPLPAALRETLIKQGETVVRVKAANKVQPLPVRKPAVAAPSARTPAVPVGTAAGARYGWYAAAASLLIALAAWFPRFETEAPPALVEAPVPSVAEQREALLAAAPAALKEEWARTEDPASVAVQGDVVWDEATQTGYMRFSGLPANDPSESQYQLWIFDGTRDDRFPVDGGVFDVPAGATEVVVPIKATLPVRQAALFAVTVEAPGGVMVSSRERIVALAQVASG
ncbi:MAG: anti-sigma factor [Steroidobacteraceae bacterium]|jgi:hypothetical protein|nr:anti-sigma factor [Steroidobacteraceae bacterium]